MRHTQKRPIATGTVRQRDKNGNLYRETCVRFDLETFAQIRAYAEQERCSFGEAVRQLIEFGLETLAEDGV